MNRKLLQLSDQLQRDRDVRIKTEESSRESKERYQLLVETAQEGIFVLQNGSLVFNNSMLLTISGYTVEEISGKPFIDFVFEDYRSFAYANHKKRLAGEDINQHYTIRAYHKSGKIIWLEISGTALPVLNSSGSAESVGNKIWKDISSPYQIDGHLIEISSSIGVAVFPEHGQTEIELLKNADKVMYRIKKSWRNGGAVCCTES